MGRIKKYLTAEEKLQSRNQASKRYYWSHKEQCDEQQRKRDQQRRENKEM